MKDFDVTSLLKCDYYTHCIDGYCMISASPCTGVLYVTEANPEFISGHVRVRGRDGGMYPYHYCQMIDNIFGESENTIEVCSGSIQAGTDGADFTVDMSPERHPSLIADGQVLSQIKDETFTRWRCDPPYNHKTAKDMYKTKLPNTMMLLAAGARVCKTGSLMFFLLGPQNYQMCPPGVKRIGLIFLSVVPNNEIRCLNIYYKYKSERKNRLEDYTKKL